MNNFNPESKQNPTSNNYSTRLIYSKSLITDKNNNFSIQKSTQKNHLEIQPTTKTINNLINNNISSEKKSIDLLKPIIKDKTTLQQNNIENLGKPKKKIEENLKKKTLSVDDKTHYNKIISTKNLKVNTKTVQKNIFVKGKKRKIQNSNLNTVIIPDENLTTRNNKKIIQEIKEFLQTDVYVNNINNISLSENIENPEKNLQEKIFFYSDFLLEFLYKLITESQNISLFEEKFKKIFIENLPDKKLLISNTTLNLPVFNNLEIFFFTENQKFWIIWIQYKINEFNFFEILNKKICESDPKLPLDILFYSECFEIMKKIIELFHHAFEVLNEYNFIIEFFFDFMKKIDNNFLMSYFIREIIKSENIESFSNVTLDNEFHLYFLNPTQRNKFLDKEYKNKSQVENIEDLISSGFVSGKKEPKISSVKNSVKNLYVKNPNFFKQEILPEKNEENLIEKNEENLPENNFDFKEKDNIEDEEEIKEEVYHKENVNNFSPYKIKSATKNVSSQNTGKFITQINISKNKNNFQTDEKKKYSQSTKNEGEIHENNFMKSKEIQELQNNKEIFSFRKLENCKNSQHLISELLSKDDENNIKIISSERDNTSIGKTNKFVSQKNQEDINEEKCNLSQENFFELKKEIIYSPQIINKNSENSTKKISSEIISSKTNLKIIESFPINSKNFISFPHQETPMEIDIISSASKQISDKKTNSQIIPSNLNFPNFPTCQNSQSYQLNTIINTVNAENNLIQPKNAELTQFSLLNNYSNSQQVNNNNIFNSFSINNNSKNIFVLNSLNQNNNIFNTEKEVEFKSCSNKKIKNLNFSTEKIQEKNNFPGLNNFSSEKIEGEINSKKIPDQENKQILFSNTLNNNNFNISLSTILPNKENYTEEINSTMPNQENSDKIPEENIDYNNIIQSDNSSENKDENELIKTPVKIDFNRNNLSLIFPIIEENSKNKINGEYEDNFGDLNKLNFSINNYCPSVRSLESITKSKKSFMHLMNVYEEYPDDVIHSNLKNKSLANSIIKSNKSSVNNNELKKF